MSQPLFHMSGDALSQADDAGIKAADRLSAAVPALSLSKFASGVLAALSSKDQRRFLHETVRLAGQQGALVSRGGRQMVSFCCNDYYNFASDMTVVQAAIDALQQYGAGAGASRLVSGNHPLFRQMERRLAQSANTEAACLFGSGYLANSGIIPTVIGPGDLILIDELAHNCIFAGARQSGARLRRFAHNDMQMLRRLLAVERNRFKNVLIATDRVFSMDGDLAPIAEISAVAADYAAWTLTDNAHALGVVPKETGIVDLHVGTLSKSLGSYGAYLCAAAEVVELMKNRCSTLIYSTALPPSVVASAIAAFDILEADPVLAARPLRNAKFFASLVGLPAPVSPIVPIILNTCHAVTEASRKLEQRGFLVVPIRPPTVPEGTARLRVAFCAAHSDEQIRALADAILAL